MGFMDKAKDLADKGVDAAADNKDAVHDGIDKGADFASEKTGGKYDGHIESGADAAKDYVEGLGDDK